MASMVLLPESILNGLFSLLDILPMVWVYV